MQADLRTRVSLLNPIHFLGLGFGSGLSPLMPGTMGSLAAVPLLVLMSYTSHTVFLVIALIAAAIGVVICEKTASALGVHDHGAIVWDEIAGMLITFLFIPITAVNLVIGFILFRIFDILKPWPISVIDKNMNGGFGIMLDDIVAALMACGCLHWINSYAMF